MWWFRTNGHRSQTNRPFQNGAERLPMKLEKTQKVYHCRLEKRPVLSTMSWSITFSWLRNKCSLLHGYGNVVFINFYKFHGCLTVGTVIFLKHFCISWYSCDRFHRLDLNEIIWNPHHCTMVSGECCTRFLLMVRQCWQMMPTKLPSLVKEQRLSRIMVLA